MNQNRQSIALFGAATDIGARHRGGSMGPEALRVAGLKEALKGQGFAVEDRGNVTGPPNPNLPARDGYRHLAQTVKWCQAVRDRYYDILRDGHFPLLLGGDHSLSIGSIAAAARYCSEHDRPLGVLWLDAHTDFNTCDTSPSGNLHGMTVAVLAGHGPPELLRLGGATPVLAPDRFVQLGIRSVDEIERRKVVDSGLTVFDMRQIDEVGMRRIMEDVLNRLAEIGGHIHVSFDVDFLDPGIAPGVGTPVAGGPTYREAQLCMEMIYDSGLMASLDIMELNPAFDHRNQTAELVVELVQSLFGEQILNRHRPDD